MLSIAVNVQVHGVGGGYALDWLLSGVRFSKNLGRFKIKPVFPTRVLKKPDNI